MDGSAGVPVATMSIASMGTGGVLGRGRRRPGLAGAAFCGGRTIEPSLKSAAQAGLSTMHASSTSRAICPLFRISFHGRRTSADCYRGTRVDRPRIDLELSGLQRFGNSIAVKIRLVSVDDSHLGEHLIRPGEIAGTGRGLNHDLLTQLGRERGLFGRSSALILSWHVRPLEPNRYAIEIIIA